MKLNNKGWGMVAFLLTLLVIMIFFFVAVSKINAL